jgi:hypothetical protein
MMKKITSQLIIPLFTLLALVGCFSAEKKDAKGSSSQRMELHKHGIIIEAKYDPRLDNLIPGYKMLTVALTNNSVDVIRLNPLKDRWAVVDAYGKPRKAINSLRIKDPQTFSRLPSQVQQLIEYPVGISVGYSETVDLFFPSHLDLTSFRSVSYYNAENKQEYDILNNLESPTHVPVNSAPGQEDQARADPRFAQ